ncbi:hypothetical protein NLI96_g7465 [Meripilus lineatus]|uniref:HORMA domain-containing protein n=1 Tax=Meripilus lineatus TaxID=2056292 RepID=A0AAD5V4C3_9APHY|nr:hypothetical protein NLI96_g7465 [Physisporinus lineatus]
MITDPGYTVGIPYATKANSIIKFLVRATTLAWSKTLKFEINSLYIFDQWDMASYPPLSFNQAVKGVTEFIEVAIHTILYGNVDKVVVVIKNKEEVALERFIFSVQNMVQVEAYNKETGVEDAMSAVILGQHFRSFLIKLSMIEAQLGPQTLGEDISFAVVVELQDNKPPTASSGEEPPPWVPATIQHTTAGASEDAELHLLRAVETGVINLSLAVQELEPKLEMERDEATGKGKGKQRAFD